MEETTAYNVSLSVMLRVKETHCILLTYAIEIVHVLDRDKKRQLRSAHNSVFRRIIGNRWFESVTNLQHFLKKPTLEELVDKRYQNLVQG